MATKLTEEEAMLGQDLKASRKSAKVKIYTVV
jgi:hypothetical protein